MFDKIKRKATQAVRRTVDDTVDKEVDRQIEKQVTKVKTEIQPEIDKSTEYSFHGMVSDKKKVSGQMITDFTKFKTSWEKNANDPAQSVMHLLIAAHNYCVKDHNIGSAMATTVLSKEHNQEDSSSPSGLKLGLTNKSLFEQMRKNPNIVKSYLGADYKQDYKFDDKSLTMDVLGIVPEGNKNLKVIIQSSGKDFPTPVSVAINNKGQWKVTEFSSIATGCKKPASSQDDF